jgi:phosphoglycolate phosphatase-like HAD superfamily hydrolase
MFPRFNEKINIVVDCDEVLTDISPLWVQKIIENRDYFDKYFDLPETFDYNTEEGYKFVLSRPTFHLNKWLLKEGINLTTDQEAELFKKFFDLYDNADFYSECSPTRMAEGIYKLSLQKYVDKIYIVTRTSEGTRESKETFLRNFLSSPKFEIVFVGKEEKKSDYIKKLDNVKIIVDDELSNIHDIMDNCDNLNEVDFYIPYTGYNEPDADLFDKADEKKFKLLYYPIFMETEITV